jgi:putative FmdB family regulatory protein
MPTYDYVCDACQHEFELFQSIKEEAKRKCPKCGRQKLRRLIGPGAAIVFKGSGFYKTDYRSESYKKAAAAEKGSSAALAGIRTTGTGLICRSSLLVRLAAVVGLVEARPLEDDGRTGPDQPAKLLLPALRTLPLGIFLDRLEQLEGVFARFANVIVGRHGFSYSAFDTITWLGRTTRSCN